MYKKKLDTSLDHPNNIIIRMAQTCGHFGKSKFWLGHIKKNIAQKYLQYIKTST